MARSDDVPQVRCLCAELLSRIVVYMQEPVRKEIAQDVLSAMCSCKDLLDTYGQTAVMESLCVLFSPETVEDMRKADLYAWAQCLLHSPNERVTCLARRLMELLA
jgi:hypothetical protein